jgi:hypothetical protein
MGFFDKIKQAISPQKKIESIEAKEEEPKTTSYFVRFTIEWKTEIELSNRNFESTTCCNKEGLCSQLMTLERLYTRADIEKISAQVGYSVYDNIGGVLNDEGQPICCCRWFSQIVTKK